MGDRIRLQQVSQSALAVLDERFVSNTGVVLMDDFIVVIDAGKSPEAARVLREVLESEYARPVRYVFITHYHADHTAGLVAFKDVAQIGSTALGRKLEEPPEWVRKELEEALKQEAVSGSAGEPEVVGPSLVFADRVRIVGGKTLELVTRSGHTDCSAYAYLAQDRVLFTGDLVVAGEFPFAGDASADPDAWIESVRAMQALDIERVVPGHGSLSGPEAIGEQLQFLETLRERVVAAVDAGGYPATVQVSDLAPVHRGKEWFVDRTLERWYAYYAAKAGT